MKEKICIAQKRLDTLNKSGTQLSPNPNLDSINEKVTDLLKEIFRVSYKLLDGKTDPNDFKDFTINLKPSDIYITKGMCHGQLIDHFSISELYDFRPTLLKEKQVFLIETSDFNTLESQGLKTDITNAYIIEAEKENIYFYNSNPEKKFTLLCDCTSYNINLFKNSFKLENTNSICNIVKKLNYPELKNIEEMFNHSIITINDLKPNDTNSLLYQNINFVIRPSTLYNETTAKVGKLLITYKTFGKIGCKFKLNLVNHVQKKLEPIFNTNLDEYRIEHLSKFELHHLVPIYPGSCNDYGFYKARSYVNPPVFDTIKSITTKLMFNEDVGYEERRQATSDFFAYLDSLRNTTYSTQLQTQNETQANMLYFGKNPGAVPKNVQELAEKIGSTYYIRIFN